MSSAFQATQPQIGNHGQGWFGKLLRGAVEIINSFGRALDATHDYERLSRASEKQLAARSLTRETLAQHIFDKHFSR